MARRNPVPQKVVPIGAARSPRGAVALPANIDHLSAQAELNDHLFPHYLLGRQLALEEVVRELFLSTPASQQAVMLDKLQFSASQGLERLTDGIADAKDEAATAGYVATLIQQGF